MALIRRKIGNRMYLYYPVRTEKGPRQMYIGPEDEPDYFKVQSILKILNRREKQIYDERLELEALLPEGPRRLQEALSKEAIKFEGRADPTSIVRELDSLYLSLSAQRVFPAPTLKQLNKAVTSMKKGLTKEQ